MKRTWLDARGENSVRVKIDSIRFIQAKEHYYSLLLLQRPWVVVPIRGTITRVNKTAKILDIKSIIEALELQLASNNYYKQLYNHCNFNATELATYTNEELELLASDCRVGASYIASFIVGNIAAVSPIFPEVADLLTIEQLRNMYGVFYMLLGMSIEEHAFVIYMTNDTITIYHSYGGVKGIRVVRAARNTWLTDFEALFAPGQEYQVQIDLYLKLWELPPSVVLPILRPHAKLEFNELFCNRLL